MTIFSGNFVSFVSGTVSNPNNALGTGDNVFTTNGNSNSNWDGLWDVDLPVVLDPIVATGTQTITLRLRKGSNSNNPTLNTIELFENGVFVADVLGGSVTISNTTLQTVTATFDGSLITDAIANGISFHITTTGAGGSPSARNSVEIDSATFDFQYELNVGTTIKVYLDDIGGPTWVPGELKYWNGTSWQPAKLQRWNGSTWVPT